MGKAGTKPNEERRKEIISLISRGESDAEIGRQMGFTRERARVIRKQLGQPPSTQRTPISVQDRAGEMYLAGKALKEISSTLCIGKGMAFVLIKRAGLVGAQRPCFNPAWPKQRSQKTLEMMDAYVRGERPTDIARRFGTTPMAVCTKAWKMKLKRGDPSPLSNMEAAE